jgi:hypothetical protein
MNIGVVNLRSTVLHRCGVGKARVEADRIAALESLSGGENG